MQRLIVLSLWLTVAAGCTGKSSQSQPRQTVIEKREVQEPYVESVPYQRLKLKRDEAKYLDRALPRSDRRIIEQAEDVEVFLLGVVDGQKITERFQSTGVLRKTKVTDENIKGNLFNALFDGIATAGNASGCFYPRHGLRATHHDKTVELEICFQCNIFRGSAPSGKVGGVISNLPHEMFNRILAEER